MTKTSERVERFTMYSVITLQTTLPISFYIYSIGTTWSFIFTLYISFSGFLVLLFASLCLCYRGFVDLTDFSGVEIPSDSKACNTCSQYKPERSHHCSTCKRCIKKMDHHCHWLGRCINYDNHGYFIKFIFSMFLNSSAVFVFNLYYGYQYIFINNVMMSHLKMLVLICTSITSLVISVVSCFHFNNQMNMVFKNVTYIETLNCENYGYSTNDSPYNLGLRHNIEEVFGPLKYFLLYKPVGNGIFFKKKYDVVYWPKHFRSQRMMYSEQI